MGNCIYTRQFGHGKAWHDIIGRAFWLPADTRKHALVHMYDWEWDGCLFFDTRIGVVWEVSRIKSLESECVVSVNLCGVCGKNVDVDEV